MKEINSINAARRAIATVVNKRNKSNFNPDLYAAMIAVIREHHKCQDKKAR